MDYLTKELFLKKVDELKVQNPEHWGVEEYRVGQPKSVDRWSYHKRAVEILKGINPKSILEAGSMGIFLTDTSDSIDLDMPKCGWRLSYTPTFNYDLRNVPWTGIKDKQYDVFVALRVFHHMGTEGKFLKEMERIANHIILAFPQYTSDKYEKIKTPTKKYQFNDTDTTLIYYRLKT